MKTSHLQTTTTTILFSSALISAAILAGCSKSGFGASSALDPAKVPKEVSQAFAKSPEEAQQAASNCVAALQDQDTTAAFAQLQKLKAQNDLTPQQRAIVVKAMQTTFKQLQTAADHGDAKAETAIHQYVSTR